MIKLSPSILSADFSNLERDIKEIEKTNTPYLHIDVMDGNFVPNISIGLPVIKSIRKKTELVFDVHLMIDEPQRYIEDFADAGADIINIHIESTKEVEKTLKDIKKLGKRAGITVKPKTPIEKIIPYINLVDLILIMTVEPGFGGQSLMDDCLDKVEFIKKYIDKNNLNIEIEVDGGIKISNVEKAILKGANVIVAGSAIFEKNKIEENIEEFYKKFKEV